MTLSSQVTALNIRRTFLASVMKDSRKAAVELVQRAKAERDRARWAKMEIVALDDELRAALDRRGEKERE